MSKRFARVDWPVKPCPDTEPHDDPHVWGETGMWGMYVLPTNSFLCAGKPSQEELLFKARNQIEQWVKTMEYELGRVYPKGRQILEQIDNYRAKRGWLPNRTDD